MDHHTTTMAAVGKKSTRPPPQWDVISGMLHMRIKDVAAELDVSVPYLRHLCQQNGFRTWPGKRIRFMSGIGRNLPIAYLQSLCRENSFPHWTNEEEDMTRIVHETVVNSPPGKELVTLNLIDKVGSSCSSKQN